jgi:hypothetical protein
MKKLCVVLGCISLIHFSCHKNHDLDLQAPRKADLIIPGTKELVFKATEIYSKLYAIRRRIEIINSKTNSRLAEIFVTLGCNDPNDNLYRKIKYEPEKFSGQITFESNHHLEFTKKILNGKVVMVKKLACNDPVSNQMMEGSCSQSQINSCFENAVDDMNWLEYASCTLQVLWCFPKVFTGCIKKLCNSSILLQS